MVCAQRRTSCITFSSVFVYCSWHVPMLTHTNPTVPWAPTAPSRSMKHGQHQAQTILFQNSIDPPEERTPMQSRFRSFRNQHRWRTVTWWCSRLINLCPVLILSGIGLLLRQSRNSSRHLPANPLKIYKLFKVPLRVDLQDAIPEMGAADF